MTLGEIGWALELARDWSGTLDAMEQEAKWCDEILKKIDRFTGHRMGWRAQVRCRLREKAIIR